ncbi:MAG: ABC transporter substrate-binding protein [Actinobacteria bacterium]|nr:ABC transporter substrate-binding protein [Actinomycetota bacterium]
MTTSTPPGGMPTETGLPRAVRRYGPLAGIVLVVAVIALLVARMPSSGTTSTATGGTGAGGGSAQVDDSSRPLSWSEAKQKGMPATFGPGCDQDPNSKNVGRIAIPSAFAAECYAQRPSAGASGPGVTADKVTIVLYQPAPDPLIDQIFAAIGANDSAESILATYKGYFEIYQKYYETYGRTIELVPFKGTGTAADDLAARADAATIAETIKPFAVLGGPLLAAGFGDELSKMGIIQIDLASSKSTDYFQERAPYNYNVLQAPDQLSGVVAEYLAKRLKGKPATYAGDPELQNKERKFGLIYLSIPGANAEELRDKFNAQLKAAGVDVPVQVGSVDPTSSAAQQIARLKQEGVTSVLFSGDPLSPKNFTAEATNQNYFPEWIVTGTALVDSTTFARTYDPQQWKHAFGISQLFARGKPDANWSYFLYRWYHGGDPPAKNAAQIIFPNPSVLFSGIMAAGPKLTAETFRDGLFAGKPIGGGKTVPQASFGNQGFFEKPDYTVIDDTVEVWFDPEATGPDERGQMGQGMYRYVDGGQRYLPGKWPAGDPKVFVQEGAVSIYETVPPEDAPPDYPSPSSPSPDN